MSYDLRPYQRAGAAAGVLALTDGRPKDHPLIVMPTGSGKSLVGAEVISQLRNHGPSIVLQPSGEILLQNQAKLRSYGIEPAVWSASMSSKETGDGVTLATIKSVVEHTEAFRHIKFAVVDECHLVNSAHNQSTGKPGQYRQFFDALPGVRILGLTATPWRMASNSHGTEQRFLTRTQKKTFKRVVHYTQIGDLFRDGYLCPLRYKSVEVFEPEQLELNSVASDFTDTSIQRALRGSDFNRRLISGIQTLLAAGRKHIAVFTRFVQGAGGANVIADELGEPAGVVHAGMPAGLRRRILEGFQAGEIKVVVNVGILALGFDFPALEAVVVGAPTMSLGKWYQMIGRVVRTHPGKEFAEVIDLCGNLERFGKIEDLVLRPGGAKGDLWAFWSKGRVDADGRSLPDLQMTNMNVRPPDNPASRRAKYWAGRNRR
jgi:DNA repair protein RadD